MFYFLFVLFYFAEDELVTIHYNQNKESLLLWTLKQEEG